MSITNKSNNSTSIPLKSATEFVGLAQSTTGFSNILVNIRTDKKAELTIQQSADKVNWDLHSLWTCDPAKSPTGFLVQEPASLPFFRVKLLNTSGEDMTRLRLVSVLNLTSNVKLNVRQDNTLVSGEDLLGEKRTLQTDASGALVVSAGGSSGLIVQSGQNTDFVFIPDATNSTSAIYADEQPPTTTTLAGWVYTNTNPQKINWYVFQDPTLPQYLVSEMDSIYCVVSQLTPATALPYIVFSTMPNGIDDAVPSFAKSVLVFAPTGAVPTAQGEYLLYVKSDPTHIRPEITNRYELTFVPANSTKTLAQAAGERLSLASIQTDSGLTTGSYYFLFQQYGITWAKTSVPLPINNGKMECNVTLQPVTLAPSTADIGFVNLKAEDRTNPGNFLNLLGYDAGAGFNLLTKDEEAGSYLFNIESYTNTISQNTTAISGYNANMETDLGFIKQSNNGIETLTDSINQKITACNTGAVVLATGSAEIGSVLTEAWDSVLRTTKILNVTEENRGGPFPVQQLETIDYNAGLALTTIKTNTAPSNGASTKTLTNTGANWTAGSSTLQSLTLSNVGGLVFSYVKLYNKATAPDQNDTPVMTIPLNHETAQQVVCNSLLFNLGIGVRATNAFVANDNTTPSGTTYATAFYKLG
jgi:hypothetical protein